MLTYLKSFLAFYSILKWIVAFFEKRKWIEEGKAQAIREQLESMEDEVKKACAADAAVDHSADSVRNDPNNRDRKPDG